MAEVSSEINTSQRATMAGLKVFTGVIDSLDDGDTLNTGMNTVLYANAVPAVDVEDDVNMNVTASGGTITFNQAGLDTDKCWFLVLGV